MVSSEPMVQVKLQQSVFYADCSEPTSGTVHVANQDFSDGGFKIKTRVGYMSQKFTLYDDLTVDENMNFAGQLRKMDPQTVQSRKDFLLDFISFNRNRKTMVKDLPGGMKQQVSLATAILHDPDVVFLDEPTAGVTPFYREKFWKLIRELAKKGKTIFVTTHYMDEAEYCHRIAMMRSGELIALDTPAKLKEKIISPRLVRTDVHKRKFAQSFGNRSQ